MHKCQETVLLKGTVSVISSDHQYTDGNARFTTEPLKPISNKKCVRYRRSPDLSSVYFLYIH